ncbi:DCTD-like protein [Mya arenaria]|uniref:dCMP deaminase n=1 Tax=Mya arenaria TaxID=6604 RepID=A0ABY7DTB6_MYAAR|nr:DCTD-like protein [Mya arenaria]
MHHEDTKESQVVLPEQGWGYETARRNFGTDFYAGDSKLERARVVMFHSSMEKQCGQVGACIAYEDKRIVSTGYNDMPNNCDNLPWGKGDPDKLNNKYVYVCHAELNAVLNKNSTDVKNCTIYVSLFPCNECAKVIIQSGIKKVMYYADKYQDSPKVKASKIMLEEAGIK